ncbi:hypothetical protein ACHAXT_012705 [Thalassiosira profunda]
MMRASQRRAARAKAHAAAETSSPTAAGAEATTAVSPSSVGTQGTGTPPLASSPGRALRTPPRGRGRPLPTRGSGSRPKRRRGDDDAAPHQATGGAVDGPPPSSARDAVEPSPPSPPRLHSALRPSPPRPNPSYDGELLGSMLASIEATGSMGSVADLVDGIEDAPASGRGEYASSEEAEAASRAAAAAVAGSNVAAGSSAANTAAAGRLLEATARDILREGSNGDDSAVVSSPSGRSNEDNTSGTRSHSPEFFALDDALLDPRSHLSRGGDLHRSHSFAITPLRVEPHPVDGAGPAAFHPSPTIDWPEGFFDDLAGSGDANERPKRRSLDSEGLAPFASFAGSFGAFGSLSNGSAEHPPAAAASNTGTVVLAPRNRLPPPRPHNNGTGSLVDGASHPSHGTLAQYDPDLYNKLREAGAPPRANLPAPLVPANARGNQLVTILGAERRHSFAEVEECPSFRTFQFYKFLREVYPALEGCAYLLPGLRGKRGVEGALPEEVECAINVSGAGSFLVGHVPGMTRLEKSKLSKSDLALAKQRIESAICAFGGTVRRTPPPSQSSDKQSIFRTRNEPPSKASPSRSRTSSSRGRRRGGGALARTPSLRRERYERKLRAQYFEHGNRLSWDVQANLALSLNGASGTFDEDDMALKRRTGSDQGEKRKNRCKKCGQMKQGHICPYASSLQRSIGVMVFASANAHVADEPGRMAPALCEMNNFIPIKGGGSSLEPERKRRKVVVVSGDESSKSGDAKPEVPNPFRRKSLFASEEAIEEKRSDDEDARGDKTDAGSGDLLFQPTMEVTLEQYRGVTPRDPFASRRDYQYPQVPLTFSQRKNTSDALFSLSRLVPGLTDECALALTEARRRDQWDLAVAELMAQTLIVLKCGEGDYTLDGLRRYLLTLGISC